MSPGNRLSDGLDDMEADNHRSGMDHEAVPRFVASPLQWTGTHFSQDAPYDDDVELCSDAAPWAVEEYHNELLQPTPQARCNFRSGGDDSWPEEVSMSPYRRRKLTVVRTSGASQTRLAWGEPQQQSIDSFDEPQQSIGGYPVKDRRLAADSSMEKPRTHRWEAVQSQTRSEYLRQQQAEYSPPNSSRASALGQRQQQAEYSPPRRAVPVQHHHHEQQQQSMYHEQHSQKQLMFDFAGDDAPPPKVFDFSSEQSGGGRDSNMGAQHQQQQQYHSMREMSNEETLHSVAEGLERFSTANQYL